MMRINERKKVTKYLKKRKIFPFVYFEIFIYLLLFIVLFMKVYSVHRLIELWDLLVFPVVTSRPGKEVENHSAACLWTKGYYPHFSEQTW